MPLPPYIAAPAPGRRAAIAPTTRPCSPGRRARSRRRPPGCISPTRWSSGCAARGIALHTVTLHVGAGTFLPVKAEDTSGHQMHAEWGSVDAATADALNAARARRRPHRRGRHDLAAAARKRGGRGRRHPAVRGETAIFITPGYRFRAVDVHADQFPSAALDAVHAGGGVQRARHDEARLRARDRRRLSLLFLRRRLPAASGRELTAMADAFSFELLHTDGAARPARSRRRTARCARRPSCRSARRRRVKARALARRCARPAPTSCSATPIT